MRVVIETFKPLCCPNYFHVGQELEIYKQPSKNRLYINAYENGPKGKFIRGSHNVKRSTFMRCTKEII